MASIIGIVCEQQAQSQISAILQLKSRPSHLEQPKSTTLSINLVEEDCLVVRTHTVVKTTSGDLTRSEITLDLAEELRTVRNGAAHSPSELYVLRGGAGVVELF